ncbi:phage major tail tube protein [Parasedimentitalea marina]|uniref:Phage major tail tube protein n=1 Tax=Parasedimentitalea marina TaxID=2483033 RepID=A0A3T0N1I2_9RHOB|nr:phage major tail tube protein [Parasedimentitalea marina]AZV77880.1 phage major tail tube protein [Parasedimentitalea marina]
MIYPRTIRNFNAFLDGVSYAGRATEGKLPELKMQVANHRGAGMDGVSPVDMGTEAMNAEVTLSEWSPNAVKLFGTRKRLVLRPAAMGEDDFSADTYVATLGGRWTSTNFGDLKPGSDVPLKLSLAVDYFRLTMNGDELFEIDILAGKRVIGGVDQVVELRKAMGV